MYVCGVFHFVVHINNLFSVVLFFAAIHKRRVKKLISRTIKYKLDSNSKTQFAFFILKTFKMVFGKLSILSKIWK